jgi:hypothetical protein
MVPIQLHREGYLEEDDCQTSHEQWLGVDDEARRPADTVVAPELSRTLWTAMPRTPQIATMP